MDASDVKFDSELTMSITIDEQPKSLFLELSDDLEAAEQDLELAYREKIARFVSASAAWYPRVVERIHREDPQPGALRLMVIFVLSEQDAESIVFGLMFRAEVDIEHGRGIKVDGEKLEILEYGIGEVAFCW